MFLYENLVYGILLHNFVYTYYSYTCFYANVSLIGLNTKKFTLTLFEVFILFQARIVVIFIHGKRYYKMQRP